MSFVRQVTPEVAAETAVLALVSTKEWSEGGQTDEAYIAPAGGSRAPGLTG